MTKTLYMVTALRYDGGVDWEDPSFFDTISAAEQFIVDYFSVPEAADLENRELFIFECDPIKKSAFSLIPKVETVDIRARKKT